MSTNNTDWQPIETAPKDGTEILVWNGMHQVTVRWNSYDYWQILEAGEFATSHQLDDDPTHWKPLGPPPQ